MSCILGAVASGALLTGDALLHLASSDPWRQPGACLSYANQLIQSPTSSIWLLTLLGQYFPVLITLGQGTGLLGTASKPHSLLNLFKANPKYAYPALHVEPTMKIHAMLSPCSFCLLT